MNRLKIAVAVLGAVFAIAGLCKYNQAVDLTVESLKQSVVGAIQEDRRCKLPPCPGGATPTPTPL